MNDTEVSIRNILLDVLNQRKSRDLESEKTFMNSTFLNGIIDLTDPDMRRQIKSTLHEEQQSWLDQVLRKQAWKPTPKFKEYCDQFTDDACNRVQVPNLVRKSFVKGRFDSFFDEGHDIAQDIMKHLYVFLLYLRPNFPKGY